MPNWTAASGERRWSSPQAASSKAGAGQGQARQNEAVMSPRLRQQIRLIAGIWLGWTIAGLFYITQDSVPRLYRGQEVAWKYVFVGWMAGMYVCAALTPALLWLGNRWPVERRVAYAALHLCFSVVFSILATVIEVPVLMLLGVFPAATPPPSIAAGVSVMLSFGVQGGVIRYWAVLALQAVYRSQKNAKIREREAFELKVQASELAQQLATAQLSALKMQLQPHFLFNTLGAIIVLIQQQKTVQAEAMVARLGDLLRLTLEDVEAQEVPLWRELEFLRRYLSIEQVRFEDRLTGAHCAGSSAVRHPRAAHGAAADRRERRPPWAGAERGGRGDRRGGHQRGRLACADRLGRWARAAAARGVANPGSG